MLKHNLKQTNTLRHDEWLDAMPVGVVIIDNQGTISKANDLAREIFIFKPMQDKWHEVLVNNVQGTSDNGHYIYTHGGRYVLLKTQALADNSGQIILLIDGSDLKQSNESMLKIEKIHSIAKLSATLAHQLRTPLATATLYASNLNIDALSKADIKHYQAKIQEQLNTIKQQIDNVLLVHKGNEAVCENMLILKEIEKSIEEFSDLHPEFKINLNAKIKADAHVIANRTALKGALNNIIENAIHASARTKEIDINLSQHQDKIILDVIDYGYGIPEENLNLVSSGFFTTKKEGNGLGLAISRSIIEAHGGNLVIDSQLGHFTKVTITLACGK